MTTNPASAVEHTALLPCPFCGGEPELTSGGPGNHYVRCATCKAGSDDSSTERTIAAWNRRTPAVNSHAALVEALRDLAVEMRQMLAANPGNDGDLYRQRLAQAEAALSLAQGEAAVSGEVE